MSRMLEESERTALAVKLRQLVATTPGGQSAVARLIGVTQGAVWRAVTYDEIGPVVARKAETYLRASRNPESFRELERALEQESVAKVVQDQLAVAAENAPGSVRIGTWKRYIHDLNSAWNDLADLTCPEDTAEGSEVRAKRGTTSRTSGLAPARKTGSDSK